MKFATFCILFVLLCNIVVAQYTSAPNGYFSLDEVKGCAPFTVVINAPECDENEACVRDFGAGNGAAELDQSLASRTFTYTRPGTYTISVLRGTQGTDELTVEVVENTPPTAEITNCGGGTVNVLITDTNYQQYIVDYDDGTQALLLSGGRHQHTLTAGSHVVEVRGRNLNAEDNCTPATYQVSVLNVIPPPSITRAEVLDNGSIKLDYNTTENIQYRLEVRLNNQTNFGVYKNFTSLTTDTVTGLNVEDNFYCFRLSAINPCTGTALPSQIICSSIIELGIKNNVNEISWTTNNDGTNGISIQKRVPSVGSTLLINNANSPFSDSPVDCGTEYCYRIITNYPSGTLSISAEKCGIAISTTEPEAVNNVISLVTDPGVILQWPSPVAFTPDTFQIFKSTEGIFEVIGNTPAFTFTDPAYTVGSNSCYRLTYTDVCGNLSKPGRLACPMTLTGSVFGDNHIRLTWTQYNGYKDGVDHYTLEKYTLEGTLLQAVDLTDTTFLDDNENLNVQAYQYVVKAFPNVASLDFSASNYEIVIKDPNLFYPTSFTPNGDNLNDLFNVYGQYITSFEMDIYNRWGELLFSTSEISTGWDGNYRGVAMPEGTYTFVARITDFAGRSFRRSGTVLLLRKK